MFHWKILILDGRCWFVLGATIAAWRTNHATPKPCRNLKSPAHAIDKTPPGASYTVFSTSFTLTTYTVLFYTGWACQPIWGSAAASRVVEPTRGLLGTSSGQSGGAKHTGDRAVEPQPGPSAANRGVRPIRGPAAASRAMRSTRGTGSGQPGGGIYPGTGSGQLGGATHPGDRAL